MPRHFPLANRLILHDKPRMEQMSGSSGDSQISPEAHALAQKLPYTPATIQQVLNIIGDKRKAERVLRECADARIEDPLLPAISAMSGYTVKPIGQVISLSPPKPDLSAFRSEIPAYAAPDRTEWKKKHGMDAFPLTDVPAKFLSRAAAAVERDAATISFGQAINAHTAIDEVNEAMAHLLLESRSRILLDPPTAEEQQAWLSATTAILVFYDPSTCSFWGYPSVSY
jgi:hypothetical protein